MVKGVVRLILQFEVEGVDVRNVDSIAESLKKQAEYVGQAIHPSYITNRFPILMSKIVEDE